MAKITTEYVLNVQAQGLKGIAKEIKALRESLGGVDTAARGTGDAFDRISKRTGELDRNLKGTAGATNNGTKAFSKMSQGMTGVLVPAYATVAANVFALTAAFGALSRAADTQQLIKASEELASQTGRNLSIVANSMKEITDSAISMKEGLTQASLAASAGFDNKTILQLTQAAKNASIALGRDLTDSLNRVFKGAIKAEPELLDELGIILRLDPATREYAASIGKSVKDLTTFEKQQAIVNNVLTQAEEKFGLLSDVSPNPYTQLSAAFSDVVTSILELINTPLAPILNFFSENTTALTGALIIFANTVLTRAIPALAKLGEEVQKDLLDNLANLANRLKSSDIAQEIATTWGDGFKNANDALIEGLNVVDIALGEFSHNLPKGLAEDITKNFDALGPSLEAYGKSISLVDERLAELQNRQDKGSAAWIAEQKALIDVKGHLEGVTTTYDRLRGSVSKTTLIIRGLRIAVKDLITNLSTLKLSLVSGFFAGVSGGFSGLVENIKNFNTHLKALIPGASAAKIALRGLSISIYTVSAAFGALINFIPIIGQIIFALSLLREAWTWFKNTVTNNAFEDANNALEKQSTLLKSSSKDVTRYVEKLSLANKSINDLNLTSKELTQNFTFQKNTLTELNSSLDDIISNKSGFGTFGANTDELAKNLTAQLNIYKEFGAIKESTKILKEFGDGEKISGDRALEAAPKIQKLNETLLRTASSSLAVRNSLSETFDALSKSIIEITKTNASLTGLDKTILGVDTILRLISSVDISSTEFISLLSQLRDFDLNYLGIKNAVEGANVLNNFIKEQTSKLESLNKEKKYFLELLERENKLIKTNNIEAKTPFEPGTIEKQQTFAEGLAKTQERINKIKDSIDTFKSALEDTFKSAKMSLENFKQQAEDANNAIKNLTRETQRIKFNIELPNVGNERFLNLSNKLAEAERKNYSIIIEESKRAANATDETVKDSIFLVDLYKKKLTELRKDEITNSDAIAQYTEKLIDANTRLQNVFASRVQSEKQSFEYSTKIIQSYIDQVGDYRKIIKETSTLGFAKSESLNALNDLNNLLKILGISLRESGESADQFADRVNAAFTQFSTYTRGIEELGNISLSSVLAATKAMDNQINALNFEAEYLKRNNTLLDERIDKAAILENFNTKTQINTLENLLFDPNIVGDYAETLLRLWDALITKQEKSEDLRRAQLDKEIAQELLKLDIENKYAKLVQEAGANATKYALGLKEIDKKIEEAGSKGYSGKKLEELKNRLEDALNTDLLKDFDKYIADSTNSLSNFNDVFLEIKNSTDGIWDNLTDNQKLQSAFANATKLAKTFGDTSITGVAGAAEAIVKFKTDIDKVGISTDSVGSLLLNLGGTLKGAFDEGSKAAKAMAVIEGIGAVITAWGSPPGPPWNLPAVAVAIANVGALLGKLGESTNLGSANSSAAQQYQSQFGAQGVQGVDLVNNTLSDGIDELVGINTKLFSAERELQLAIKNLSKSFDSLGQALSQQFSSININLGGATPTAAAAGNTTNLFGSIASLFGFGGSSKTKEIIGAGIKLKSSIEIATDEFIVSLDNAQKYVTEQVTKTKSGFFGSKTRTRIYTNYSNLSDEIITKLEKSFDLMGQTLTGLVDTLAKNLGVSFQDLVTNVGDIVVDTKKIDLAGKTAKEQSEAIAAYFTNLTDKVLESILPSLYEFSTAGETLTDTLFRILSNINTLNEALSTVGVNLKDVSFGSDALSQEYEKYNKSIEFTIGSQISEIEKKITYLTDLRNTWISKSDRQKLKPFIKEQFDFSITTWSFPEFQKSIDKLIARLKGNLDELTKDVYDTFAKFSFEATAKWQEALLANFKDTSEFNTTFEKFSKSIYSDSELAQIAIDNAQSVLTAGYDQLVAGLQEIGRTDLTNIIDPSNITKTSIRDFYDAATAADLFSVKFNEATGEFDTSGADLFALLIEMGSAFTDLQDTIQKADTAVVDFERDILRQIQTFGQIGKTLDLLQLQFDYEDTIKKAQELGADLTLVEQLYGLKRLDIIKKYNDEIVNNLDNAFNSISDSVLTLIKSFDSWDEVAYSVLKVNKLSDKLQKGLDNLGISFDFSAFTNIFDTQKLADFTDTFGSLLTFSNKIPENINDEIALIEEVKQAVIDRYNSEIQSVNELQSLADDINAFLKSLAVSDVSPLTNSERFAELFRQYSDNVKNVTSQNEAVSTYAKENLLPSSQNLLEFAKEFYGIGPQFQEIFKTVTKDLQGINLTVDNLTPDGKAMTALQQDTLDQLLSLDDILSELQDLNSSNLTTELTSFADNLIIPLDTINSTLLNINDSTWEPIKNILSSFIQIKQPYDTNIFNKDYVTKLTELGYSLNDIQTTLQGQDSISISGFTNLSNTFSTSSASINSTLLNINDSTLEPMKEALSLLVGVPAYDVGSYEIPFDQLAKVHKGEMILTPQIAESVRSGESIITNNTTNNTTNNENINSEQIIAAINTLTRVLADSQIELIEQSSKIVSNTAEKPVYTPTANTRRLI